MTRVYEKSHRACKSASIAMVITSKNSWMSSLSINVTFIANKCVFYVKKNWETLFCRHALYDDSITSCIHFPLRKCKGCALNYFFVLL